jgi:hypothetical protein
VHELVFNKLNNKACTEETARTQTNKKNLSDRAERGLQILKYHILQQRFTVTGHGINSCLLLDF